MTVQRKTSNNQKGLNPKTPSSFPTIEELDALSTASPAKAIEIILEFRTHAPKPHSDVLSEKQKCQADLARILGNALWRLNRYDDAKQELEGALKDYITLGDKRGIMITKNYLGVVSERMGHYPLALKFFLEAYNAFPEGRTEDIEVMILNNIGFSYFHLSQYDEAMTYHDKALRLAKKLGHPLFLAATYNNIGNVYAVKSQSDEAVSFFQKSLDISIRENLTWGINHGLNQITLELLKLRDFEKAITYANDALSLALQTHDERQEASALKNRAEALLHLGKWSEATSDLLRALSLSKQLRFNENLFPIYIALGDLKAEQEQEEPPSEREDENQWYEKALDLAVEMQSKNFQSIANKKRAEWFKQNGKYQEAFLAMETHFELEKEMVNDSSQRHLRNFQALYEVEEAKRQAEIEAKRSEALTHALKISEEANALKNDLLSIAAHDLKNPLQLISRLSQLIVSQPSKEKTREYAETIDRSTRRMLGLVTSLIETAALEHGAMEFKKEPVDLVFLLKEVLHTNTPLAAEKKQHFKCRIATQATCIGDDNALRECFDNLLSNAIKFSPMHSEIRLTLLEHNDRIRLSVSDSGPGLSESDFSNLFKPFKTLSAKPTGNERSSGLGLSITKRFVEAHQGRLWCENNAQKPGATFILDLPKHNLEKGVTISKGRRKATTPRSAKKLPSKPVFASSTSPDTRLRIAIVEDGEEYRRTLKEFLLTERAIEIVGDYGSAEEAEEELSNVDIILLDIGLPGKSGIDAIHVFKEKFPLCKIILITVFDDDLHLTRALFAGANGYLLKNSSDDEIREAIATTKKGGMPMSPKVAARVMQFFVKYVPKDHDTIMLTPRELEILARLTKGFSVKEIAASLFISFNTVQNHLAKIYDKMHVNSKSEAVAKALRSGLTW